MPPRLLLAVLLLFAFAILPAHGAETIAAAEVVQRADQLLKAGKADEAYQLLAPLEAQLAGKYQYDYLLGIAALESDRPTTATFALERVLSVKPNFAGARMDLARAYFALGDYGRAGREFEKILSLNPPEHAREVAERYLGAIARVDSQSKPTRLSGYLELGAGHDTNVNSSPDQSTVFIPVFGLDFNLDASNQQTDDNYLQTAGGVSVSHRLKESASLFGSIDATSRRFADASEFDQDAANGIIGVALGSGRDTVKVGIHTGRFWLDEDVNRDNYGMDLSLQHFYEPSAAVTLFAQHNRLRHADEELEANDVNQNIVGVNWFRALSGTGSDVVFFSSYLGQENDINGRADGAKSLVGFGVGGQKALTPSLALYGNFGLQYGNYKEINQAFQVDRRDEFRVAEVGVSWSVSKDWSLRTDLTHYDNESNIAINDYDRTDASISVRRDFR